jgi:cellulose synthase operon protein C
LQLARPTRDAFRVIKLVAPLKKSLAAKRKALEAARNAYRTAMDYRVGEVTTAATYETADLYRQLGKDIMQSERPRKLSKDEREQYDTLLEEQAFPFEEQAIGIHEVNAARAREGLWDDSVKASYAALAELKPARYAKSEVLVSSPVLAAAAAARQSGDLAKAEELLTKQVDGSASDLLVLAELAYVQRLRGKFAEARQSYEKAIALDATYAPAQRNLGVLLDLFVDDPQAALAALERYRALTGEEKPVSGWIAEIKQRLAKSAKPAAEPPGGAT